MSEENYQNRINFASLIEKIDDKSKSENVKIDHERDDTMESSKISVRIRQ